MVDGEGAQGKEEEEVGGAEMIDPPSEHLPLGNLSGLGGEH